MLNTPMYLLIVNNTIKVKDPLFLELLSLNEIVKSIKKNKRYLAAKRKKKMQRNQLWIWRGVYQNQASSGKIHTRECQKAVFKISDLVRNINEHKHSQENKHNNNNK